jgi:hypothetical protein
MGSKAEKDTKVLEKFIQVYCEAKHSTREKPDFWGLCDECRGTLDYAIHRRAVCPLDPKPTCKNCEIHCYEPGHRQKIKDIMRHSGMHLILRGRLDWLVHYFF